MRRVGKSILAGLTLGLGVQPGAWAAASAAGHEALPRPLSSYPEIHDSLFREWGARIAADPFNLVATIIFALAVVHTFLTPKFRRWAHHVEAAHAARLKARSDPKPLPEADERPEEVSFAGHMLHFLGEVEAVFALWAIPLMIAIAVMKGWTTAVDYVGERVDFTEALFVVVIMALTSTRPVFSFALRALRALARVGRSSLAAWWLVVLIVAPLLGSVITEPAAMTIGALLLARQFYTFRPSAALAYATIGVLFVNVSVGGTLTHFAAPPVLLVAGTWHWGTAFMFEHFGWRAVLGIVISTVVYYAIFRREFAKMEAKRRAGPATDHAMAATHDRIPFWVTAVHLVFIGWTILVAHFPALFIGGFLFFLVFTRATAHHQNPLELRAPLLVGFFLAGLVVHGGLQGWWIEPLLRRLDRWPLFIGATTLTAFNDNAAITYLASLVPGFTDALKYAVVAGAVTGGGLTVIANAPNPAGQAILQKFFPDGISPLGLFLGAFLPTLIVGACFMFV